MQWIILILASLASGAFYRMGGTNLGTKWRDIPCALLTASVAFMFTCHCLRGITMSGLHAILLFGALTTYYKFTNKWFHHRKDRMYWHNWLACGIAYSLASLPLLFADVPWYLIGARVIVLALLTTGLSELFKNVWFEETSRGIVLTASVGILGIQV